jgi:hypothetical protein
LSQGTNFVDEKVLPRKEYEYRVTATNEGGESDPSESSGLIKARPEKEKPQFDKDQGAFPKEIKVRAGQPIKLELPIFLSIKFLYNSFLFGTEIFHFESEYSLIWHSYTYLN